MIRKNRIVASVLASMLLSACTTSDYASDENCQDSALNHPVPVKHHKSLVYAGPINDIGYMNIYDRYENLDTLYFVPSFRMVEGSLLVGSDNHPEQVYPSGNSFEDWLLVQSGDHHKVCTDKFPRCLKNNELSKFYQSTGSHLKDHDREAYLLSRNSSDVIQFKFDSAALEQKAIFEAKEIAQYLKRYPQKKIEVLGSADSIGPAKYNRSLSKRRAESVRDELVALGIPSSQIILSWEGEYKNGVGPAFRVAELSYE